MSEIKVITHTNYTYETTDGREFEDELEAETWQKALDAGSQIIMLNDKFVRTRSIDEAFYVHIRTWEQQKAFTQIQAYYGLCANIPKPGHWYYNDCTDSYVQVEEELIRLQGIMAALTTAVEEGQ